MQFQQTNSGNEGIESNTTLSTSASNFTLEQKKEFQDALSVSGLMHHSYSHKVVKVKTNASLIYLKTAGSERPLSIAYGNGRGYNNDAFVYELLLQDNDELIIKEDRNDYTRYKMFEGNLMNCGKAFHTDGFTTISAFRYMTHYQRQYEMVMSSLVGEENIVQTPLPEINRPVNITVYDNLQFSDTDFELFKAFTWSPQVLKGVAYLHNGVRCDALTTSYALKYLLQKDWQEGLGFNIPEGCLIYSDPHNAKNIMIVPLNLHSLHLAQEWTTKLTEKYANEWVSVLKGRRIKNTKVETCITFTPSLLMVPYLAKIYSAHLNNQKPIYDL